MTYRFLNASLPIQKTPKETFTADFQNNMDNEFYTASDWFTIQREVPYGSEEYEDVDVRINTLFQAKTAVAVGDDFKKLLFKSPLETPSLGTMFQFDNNYWIVVNLENIKNIATTSVVRRCNNLLRWKDFYTGLIYSQPCVIDYLIKETRDYSTGGASLVQPSGFLEVIAQFNERSNKIRPSKRFLFGNPDNWNAFKIMGGGINNYNNAFTSNMMSTGLLRLSMLANQTNENTDDLINGVADYGEYTYSITLNESSISLSVGSSYTLIPTIELNEQTVVKNVVWSSSNTSIATVNSSGTITPISTGSVQIQCALLDNPSTFDTCSILVTSSGVDNYSILLTPNKDYIFEGEEQTFITTLYKNGSAQSDVFTYSLNTNGVPNENFEYNVLSGNTFWVRNIKRYDLKSLMFTATSGANSIQIPIKLKGNW